MVLNGALNIDYIGIAIGPPWGEQLCTIQSISRPCLCLCPSSPRSLGVPSPFAPYGFHAEAAFAFAEGQGLTEWIGNRRQTIFIGFRLCLRPLFAFVEFARRHWVRRAI